MKKHIYIFLLLIVFISCKKSTDNNFYIILNENFLTFTDTIAYKHHTFFLVPNDTIVPNKNLFNGCKICIDKNFGDSKDYEKGLRQELIKSEYSNYLQLLNKKSELLSIDIKKLTETGKYEIIDLSNCNDTEKSSYVGTLKFYQSFINENYAIIFFSKQSSPKAGVVYAFLFKKIDYKWKIEKKVELERW